MHKRNCKSVILCSICCLAPQCFIGLAQINPYKNPLQVWKLLTPAGPSVLIILLQMIIHGPVLGGVLFLRHLVILTSESMFPEHIYYLVGWVMGQGQGVVVAKSRTPLSSRHSPRRKPQSSVCSNSLGKASSQDHCKHHEEAGWGEGHLPHP